jgi:choline dehydrogenase-like flavoprotein
LSHAIQNNQYDVVIVGTGFASSFFLHRLLANCGPQFRILVLERGENRDIAWQRSNFRQLHLDGAETFENLSREKEWLYTPSFGGGSNCWWACTPRLLPEDFEMKSRYGFDRDWPISYEELEPYYCDAEEIMQVAGDSNSAIHPRSRPFPQAAHIITAPDRLLAAAFPKHFNPMPCARARNATRNRPACCASGVCNLCPIDAKFTILNELSGLFQDPRVTLELGAEALHLETAAGVPDSLVYERDSQLLSVRGDHYILGANAIFNPSILLRSGLKHSVLGRRLNEQLGVEYTFDLDGLDNFQGSTSLTGHGYMEYLGVDRTRESAALIETSNIPHLRLEKDKWRQRLVLKFIFEDKPQMESSVRCESNKKPQIEFSGFSEYTLKAVERIDSNLVKILAPLPIKELVSRRIIDTEGHILGTTCMGKTSQEGIVDNIGRSHQWPNVVVLGGSNFPSSSPSNPTLTICATALRSAEKLYPKRTA